MTRVKICGITNLIDAQMALTHGVWALGFIFCKNSPRYISPSKARKIIEQLPPFVTAVGVFVNQKEGAVRDICRFTRIHTVQFHGEETVSFCQRFKDYKIIKAFAVNADFDIKLVKPYPVDAYLFDTYQKDLYPPSQKTTGLSVDECENKFARGILPERQALGELSVDNPRSFVSRSETAGVKLNGTRGLPLGLHGGSGKTFNWDIIKAYSFNRPFILSGGLTPENVQQGVGGLKPYAVDVSSGVEKSPGVKDPHKLKAFIEAVNKNFDIENLQF